MAGCGCTTLGHQHLVTAGCLASGENPWPVKYSGLLRRASEKCSSCLEGRSVLLLAVCGLHRRSLCDLLLCRSCAAHAMLPDAITLRVWQPQGRYHVVVLLLLAARALDQLLTARLWEGCSWTLVVTSESEALLTLMHAGVQVLELCVVRNGEFGKQGAASSAFVYFELAPPRGLLHESRPLFFLCAAAHSNLLPVRLIARMRRKAGHPRFAVLAEERGLRVKPLDNFRTLGRSVSPGIESRSVSPYSFGTPPPTSTDVINPPGAPFRPPRFDSSVFVKGRETLLAFPRHVAAPGGAAPRPSAGTPCSEWQAQFGCCQYCGLFLHPPSGKDVGMVNKFVLDVPRGSANPSPEAFDIEHLAGVGVMVADPLQDAAGAQVLLCPQCIAKTQALADEVASVRPGGPDGSRDRGLFAYLQRRSGMSDLVFCHLVTRRTDSGHVPVDQHSDSSSESSGGHSTHRHSYPESDSDEFSEAGFSNKMHELSGSGSEEDDTAEGVCAGDPGENGMRTVPRTEVPAAQGLALAHFSNLRESRLLWLRFDGALRVLYTQSMSASMHSPDLHRGEYSSTPACEDSVALTADEVRYAVDATTGRRDTWARCTEADEGARWVVCADRTCQKHSRPYALSTSSDVVFRRAALVVLSPTESSVFEVYTPSVVDWEQLKHSFPQQTKWVRRRHSASDVRRPSRTTLRGALAAANRSARAVRVFRRIAKCSAPLEPREFESPQADCLARCLSRVAASAAQVCSLHAYAFLLHVMGSMAYYELTHTEDVCMSRRAFLYLTWKRYVVDMGSARDGSGDIVSQHLLGLPVSEWREGIVEHARRLLLPAGSRLRQLFAETQQGLVRAHFAAPLEGLLLAGPLPGEAAASLREMLRFVWTLETVAHPAEARACGFRTKRQLMLMHYLLAAMTTTDAGAFSMRDAVLCQLRLDLVTLP